MNNVIEIENLSKNIAWVSFLLVPLLEIFHQCMQDILNKEDPNSVIDEF